MSAITQPIGHGHGAPPPAFVAELVSLFADLSDDLFAVNEEDWDIFTLLEHPDCMGPLVGISVRRAALCAALLVDAGFESDWNWNEGADTTAGPETPEETESGVWQASWNSVNFDDSLRIYAASCGVTRAADFIASKPNHAFQVGYVVRLFRFNTRWSGPANRGWISGAVSPQLVAELQALLGLASSSSSSSSSASGA
jgi:hypothetical protein